MCGEIKKKKKKTSKGFYCSGFQVPPRSGPCLPQWARRFFPITHMWPFHIISTLQSQVLSPKQARPPVYGPMASCPPSLQHSHLLLFLMSVLPSIQQRIVSIWYTTVSNAPGTAPDTKQMFDTHLKTNQSLQLFSVPRGSGLTAPFVIGVATSDRTRQMCKHFSH